MTAQLSMLPPTPAEERAEETDTAERCDDPTPRGVIRAALDATVPGRAVATWQGSVTKLYNAAAGNCGTRLLDDAHPLCVLDVGAGYGAWSSEMRRLAVRQGWPVHITGCEILEARRKHMRKWCDLPIAGVDWREFADLGNVVIEHSYDLAIGNPPFDELTGPKGAKRPPEQCMPAVLLRHAPAVLLLHTQQAFLKSAAGRASWRHNPPAATWLLPGGLKFRGPDAINPKTGNKYGADSDCYQVTLWLRGHSGPCSTYLLDDLPPEARTWVQVPGSEQPSVCKSCDGRPEAGPLPWDESCRTGECPDCAGSGHDPQGDLPAAPGWQP